MVFDQIFFTALDLMVHTNLFDFSLRPLSVEDRQVMDKDKLEGQHKNSISGCMNFNEFYGKVVKKDANLSSRFHDMYIKK